MGGNPNTHIKCRETIQTAIENFDLNDICRVFNGNTIQFTWHSSSKLYIFSRLDYFPVSNSLVCLFVFVALRPMSTAMVIAGRSVHLTTLFPGQA